MAATETLPDARLVIVDNDSQDGSFEKLRDAVAARPWKSRAEVLQSGHNGGFGAGNNFGIRHNLSSNDPADYFYILNPDAFPAQRRGGQAGRLPGQPPATSASPAATSRGPTASPTTPPSASRR